MNFSKNIIELLAIIPTTNLRIVFTLFLIFMFAIDHLITHRAPDGLWLAFLGTMAGVDVAQFATKRFSNNEYRKDKLENAPSSIEVEVIHTTDVQELSTYTQSNKG